MKTQRSTPSLEPGLRARAESATTHRFSATCKGDQCLDAPCFRGKVKAHINRELAESPELVQVETSWRPAKEQRPGVVNNHDYRELDTPENLDAEPECENTRTALVVFGKQTGQTLTIGTGTHCSLHDSQERASRA